MEPIQAILNAEKSARDELKAAQEQHNKEILDAEQAAQAMLTSEKQRIDKETSHAFQEYAKSLEVAATKARTQAEKEAKDLLKTAQKNQTKAIKLILDNL